MPQQTKTPPSTVARPDAPVAVSSRLYLILLVAIVAVVLLTVITLPLLLGSEESTVSGDPPAGTTEPSETDPEESTEHVDIRYPSAPSRESYLTIDAGETISDSLGVIASSAILIDLEDYSVLASRSPDEKIYPASMTKIMTLIVACETVQDASVELSISKEVLEYCRSEDAPVIAMDPGDIFTITSLLYGIGVESTADASLTVANYLYGSEENFVKAMNDKAAALGLTKTHFANCTGLDNDENYSTVREIATILAYALDNPFCKEILTTHKVTVPLIYHQDGERRVVNRYLTNTLTGRLGSAGYSATLPAKLPSGITVLGGKTGYTTAGKYCLASFAKDENDRLYILVTAAGKTQNSSATDMNLLYGAYAKQP